MGSKEKEAARSVISEAGRSLMDNEAMKMKGLLGSFRDSSNHHLGHLRICLDMLERYPHHPQGHATFVGMLMDCNSLKESADKTQQDDIKQLIRCFEVVIELIRRGKIRMEDRSFRYLRETIDAISRIIQTRLELFTADSQLINRLRKGFEEIPG